MDCVDGVAEDIRGAESAWQVPPPFKRGNLCDVVESYLFVSLDSDRGRSASRLMSNTNNLDVSGKSFVLI